MAHDSSNHSNVTPEDVHDIAPGTSMVIFHEDRARVELSSEPIVSEPNGGTISGQRMTSDISATLEPIQTGPLGLEITSSIPPSQPSTLGPLSSSSGLRASSVELSVQVNRTSSTFQSSALLGQLPTLGNTSSGVSPVNTRSVPSTMAVKPESRELCSLSNPSPGGQYDNAAISFSIPVRTKGRSIRPPPRADPAYSLSSILDSIPSSGFGGTIAPLSKTESSLEPGEVRSISTPTLHQHQSFVVEEPPRNNLGFIDPRYLSRIQLLFALGVINLMAKLQPRFEFKFGDRDGSRIGARLTLYGHTILVEPIYATIDRARVEGCRLALEELKKYNPTWLFPPLPMDGPIGSEWDWTKLLADYCQETGLGPPRYYSHVPNFYQWHSEVTIGNEHFHATRECSTEQEARNRAAHIALRDLIISEFSNDNQYILPAESQYLPEVKTGGNSAQLRPRRLSADPSSSDDRGRYYSNPNSPIWRGSRRAKANNASRKRRNHGPLQPPAKRIKETPSNASATYRPIPSVGEGRKILPLKSAQPKGTKANCVPVENSRLPEVEVEEKVDNRFETLKTLQEVLKKFPGNAAYLDLMTAICEVINVQRPEIQFHPTNPSDHGAARGQHTISAFFDQGHPFLSRASPIFLANVNQMGANAAESLGIMKLILYLLRMLREDAALDFNDAEYKNDLKFLRDLESEVELRFARSI
ncbi:unnamed protein product [Penicillium pancosmium]